MTNPSMKNAELIEENFLLKQRIQELEKSAAERKMTEQKFIQREANLRGTFDQSPVGSVIVGLDKHFIRCNSAFCNFLGYSENELIGKTISDITYPDDLELGMKELKQIAEGEIESSTVQKRYLRKDGNLVWGETSICLVRDANNNPLYFLPIIQNITDRKRAEETLREQQNKLSSIFRAAPVGIGMVVDRVFREANDTLCEMTGYSREELLGQNARMLYPTQEDFDYVGREKYRQIAKNRIGTVETHWKRKDGTVMDIILSSTPLDPDDLAKGVTFTALDITARKQAEETLRESEERYRGILEEMDEAYYEIDLKGNFTFFNESMCKTLGYNRHELMGMNNRDYTSPETAKKALLTFNEIYRTGSPRTMIDYEIIRKDGERRSLETSILPIKKSSGEIIGFRGVSRDVTERIKTDEEKRRLLERLQQADKMESIGTLAGGIAHDFNNLLMGIQGYAALSLMNLGPADPNYERLKGIEEQVQRGADLTKQLLGFARGGRYDVKPFDMNDVIEKTASMFGRTKKEITIYRKYAKDLWSAEVDLGQMEQVFMNLYVNAWQAMPGSGDIYLETENVLLNNERAFPYTIKPGRYVKMSVTDTGTGIDEKIRERIFDPFFTTKKMGRGTGLGLATVYGIIKGHGGMINVYSEVGHGTTFTIYLPASEKEAVKEKIAIGTITRGTETILLVDDEKMVLVVSKGLLESMGYKVYAAGSGQEAIAVYMEKRKKIDLVILDMIMPGISGGETFDRLREINPTIKVLLSSGYSLNGEAKHIMERGCNGFLQKPFHLEQLSSKVREMLD